MEHLPRQSPRGSWRLLRDRVFGPFVLATIMSASGVWTYSVVAAVVAFQVSGSATVVGIVGFCQFGPQLLLAPWSGAAADRGDPKRQLVVGRVLAAAGPAVLAAWIAMVGGADGLPSALPVMACSAVVGIGFIIGGPAMHSILPALVDRDELPAAIAVSNLPYTVARATAPAVAALALATAGPAAALGIAAVENAACALLLFFLPIGRKKRARGEGDQSVLSGLRHLRTDPGLVRLLVAVAAIGVATDPVTTLTPPIADELGAGADAVGLLASAFGVGAALALLLLTGVRRRIGLPWGGQLGMAVMAVTTVCFGLAWELVGMAAMLVIAGAGMTIALTSVTTQIQQRLPGALRGRVMAVYSMSFLGARALAAVVDGVVADLASVEAALVLVALVLAVGGWMSRPALTRP